MVVFVFIEAQARRSLSTELNDPLLDEGGRSTSPFAPIERIYEKEKQEKYRQASPVDVIVVDDATKGDDDDPSKLPSRGIIYLFRTYASCKDKLFIFIGAIFACGAGSILPLNSVVLGHIFSGNSADTTQLANNIKDAIPWLLVLGGSSFTCNMIHFNCFMRTSERITRRVKEACFVSLLQQECGYFDKATPGQIVGSITENSNLILGGIGDKLGVSLQFFSQFVAGFTIAYLKCWRVAAVMTACLPALSCTVGVLIIFVVKLVKKSTNSYEEASGVASEVLSQIQTVASFSGEKRSMARYEEKLLAAEKAGIKLSAIRGCGLAILFLSVFLTYGVGYWYGSLLIASGEADFGTVLTSVLACVIGSISLGIAAPNISAVAQAKAGSAAIHKYVDRRSKIVSRSDGRRSSPSKGKELLGSVEFHNVDFRYPSRPDALALNNLSMTIQPGKTYALVGSSGCGKSTCIALLQRFYDVENGKVMIDGVDVRDYCLAWLRERIALVAQEPVLFDTTIAENIRYGKPGATIKEVVAAAKDANAHGFVMSFPDGYDTKIGAGGGKLSGGQKQRIAIARPHQRPGYITSRRGYLGPRQRV